MTTSAGTAAAGESTGGHSSSTTMKRIRALAAHTAEAARSRESTFTKPLDDKELRELDSSAASGAALDVASIQKTHPQVAAFFKALVEDAGLEQAEFWNRYRLRCHEASLEQAYGKRSSSTIKQLCKEAGIDIKRPSRRSGLTRQSSSLSVASDAGSCASAASSAAPSVSASSACSSDAQDHASAGNVLLSPKTGKPRSSRAKLSVSKTIQTLTNLEESVRTTQRQTMPTFNPYGAKDLTDEELDMDEDADSSSTNAMDDDTANDSDDCSERSARSSRKSKSKSKSSDKDKRKSRSKALKRGSSTRSLSSSMHHSTSASSSSASASFAFSPTGMSKAKRRSSLQTTSATVIATNYDSDAGSCCSHTSVDDDASLASFSTATSAKVSKKAKKHKKASRRGSTGISMAADLSPKRNKKKRSTTKKLPQPPLSATADFARGSVTDALMTPKSAAASKKKKAKAPAADQAKRSRKHVIDAPPLTSSNGDDAHADDSTSICTDASELMDDVNDLVTTVDLSAISSVSAKTGSTSNRKRPSKKGEKKKKKQSSITSTTSNASSTCTDEGSSHSFRKAPLKTTNNFADTNHESAQEQRVAELRKKRAAELLQATAQSKGAANTVVESVSSVQQNYEHLRAKKQQELRNVMDNKQSINPDDLGKEEQRKQKERVQKLKKKGEDDTQKVKEARKNIKINTIGAEEARLQKERVENLKKKGEDDLQVAKQSKKTKSALEQQQQRQEQTLEEEQASKSTSNTGIKKKKSASSKLASPKLSKKKKSAKIKPDDLAGIKPTDEDVLPQNPSHPGTLVCLDLVAQHVVPDQEFTSSMYKQIKKELEPRRFLVQSAAADVDGDGDGDNATTTEWREATKQERINYLASQYNLKKEATKQHQPMPNSEEKKEDEMIASQINLEDEVAKLEAARQEIERIRAEKQARAKAAEDARVQAEEKVKAEANAAQLKAEANAAQLKAEEEAQLKAEKEAEAAQLKAESEAKAEAEAAEAARVKAEEEEAKAVAEAKAKAEAEAEEAARVKEDEETKAKIKAEAEEAARLKAEAEAKAKAEAEEAQAKAEAEEAEAERLKAEVDAKSKAAAEAAQLKAEEARLQVEAEAKAKAEAEAEAKAAQSKAEEEARILAEAEEAARLKAARQQAESEAARLKAEAKRLKAEQEARRKAEEEAARLMAEEEARAEAEREAHRAAEHEAARLKAQEEAQVRAEEEAAKLMAEEQARMQAAEEKAKLEAEANAKEDTEAESEAAKSTNTEQSGVDGHDSARANVCATNDGSENDDDDNDDDNSYVSDVSDLDDDDDEEEDLSLGGENGDMADMYDSQHTGISAEDGTLGDDTLDNNESISSLQSFVDEDEARQKAMQVLEMLKKSNERVARRNSLQRAPSMRFEYESRIPTMSEDRRSPKAGLLKRFSQSARHLTVEPMVPNQYSTQTHTMNERQQPTPKAKGAEPNPMMSPKLSKNERLQMEKQLQMERLKKSFRDLDLGLEDVVEAQKKTQELLIQETVEQIETTKANPAGRRGWLGSFRSNSTTSLNPGAGPQNPRRSTVEIIEEGDDSSVDDGENRHEAGGGSQDFNKTDKLFSSFRSLGFGDKPENGKDIEALPDYNPEDSKEFTEDDMLNLDGSVSGMDELKAVDAIGVDGIEILKQQTSKNTREGKHGLFRLPTLNLQYGKRKAGTNESDNTSVLSYETDSPSNCDSDITPKAGIMQRMFRRRSLATSMGRSRASSCDDCSLSSIGENHVMKGAAQANKENGNNIVGSEELGSPATQQRRKVDRTNSMIGRMRGMLVMPTKPKVTTPEATPGDQELELPDNIAVQQQ